jgi:hypothetical protein
MSAGQPDAEQALERAGSARSGVALQSRDAVARVVLLVLRKYAQGKVP